VTNEAKDLIRKLLVVDVDKRLTAHQVRGVVVQPTRTPCKQETN
jgi:hypothetical protein